MSGAKVDTIQVYSFVVKLSDIGPVPIATRLQGMVEEDMLDMFTLSQGAYFTTVLGQSTQKFTGLFGPLPVRDYYDYLSYLFAFELNDQSLSDERLEGKAYCVMSLFFLKSEIESMNFLRNYVEAALWRYLKFKTIVDINDTFLSGIEEVLQQVYRDTSVERTDNKVIIRKRIENAITKTEIKQKIEGLKDKSRWTIISDQSIDFPMTVEGLLGLLADQVQRYEKKGTILLANGKIQGQIISIDQVAKRRGDIKNTDGLIFTFMSTTKGIQPKNPQIKNLQEILEILSESKDPIKVAVTIEGEYETSQAFESSISSISASIPASLLFAHPITFFPIARDFPEKTWELINFLLEKSKL